MILGAAQVLNFLLQQALNTMRGPPEIYLMLSSVVLAIFFSFPFAVFVFHECRFPRMSCSVMADPTEDPTQEDDPSGRIEPFQRAFRDAITLEQLKQVE